MYVCVYVCVCVCVCLCVVVVVVVVAGLLVKWGFVCFPLINVVQS